MERTIHSFCGLYGSCVPGSLRTCGCALVGPCCRASARLFLDPSFGNISSNCVRPNKYAVFGPIGRTEWAKHSFCRIHCVCMFVCLWTSGSALIKPWYVVRRVCCMTRPLPQFNLYWERMNIFPVSSSTTLTISLRFFPLLILRRICPMLQCQLFSPVEARSKPYPSAFSLMNTLEII